MSRSSVIWNFDWRVTLAGRDISSVMSAVAVVVVGELDLGGPLTSTRLSPPTFRDRVFGPLDNDFCKGRRFFRKSLVFQTWSFSVGLGRKRLGDKVLFFAHLED